MSQCAWHKAQQQVLATCVVDRGGALLEGPPLAIFIDVIQNHAESWLDSWFDSLLILIVKQGPKISRDEILRMCTKIYTRIYCSYNSRSFDSWFQNYIDSASDSTWFFRPSTWFGIVSSPSALLVQNGIYWLARIGYWTVVGKFCHMVDPIVNSDTIANWYTYTISDVSCSECIDAQSMKHACIYVVSYICICTL